MLNVYVNDFGVCPPPGTVVPIAADVPTDDVPCPVFRLLLVSAQCAFVACQSIVTRYSNLVHAGCHSVIGCSVLSSRTHNELPFQCTTCTILLLLLTFFRTFRLSITVDIKY